MTYTFAKAHNGEIGDSIVELDKLDVALGVEEARQEEWRRGSCWVLTAPQPMVLTSAR